MQNDGDMSIDASDASMHALNTSKYEENPADVSGMSLDDDADDETSKYNPEEITTAVMLQDPESDDESDDEYVPKDDEEEEEDELADDQDLEPEPKPERGRLAGSNEEEMEVVRRVYGTDNPFYSGFTGTHRPSTELLDAVDQEEAVMTDGEEDEDDDASDDDEDGEVKPSVDAGVTIDKLDLNDDEDDDEDFIPEE